MEIRRTRRCFGASAYLQAPQHKMSEDACIPPPSIKIESINFIGLISNTNRDIGRTGKYPMRGEALNLKLIELQ